MSRKIAQFALVVKDYDEAISFYTNKLNFVLIEDTVLSLSKRWVIVSPTPEAETRILLAKASNATQSSAVGNQTGGRVGFFLFTDNFEKEHQNLIDNKVKIIREPQSFNYGKVLVFADLYGNLWDLIQPSQK